MAKEVCKWIPTTTTTLILIDTLFATLMSIYNFSGTLSSELGGLLTSALGVGDGNYGNLTLLVVICTLSGGVPLLFTNLLDAAVNDEEG